jgi:hypothetical protein
MGFWDYSGEDLARFGDPLSLFRPGKGITRHLPVYRFPDLAVEVGFLTRLGNHGDKSGCKGFFYPCHAVFRDPWQGAGS